VVFFDLHIKQFLKSLNSKKNFEFVLICNLLLLVGYLKGFALVENV